MKRRRCPAARRIALELAAEVAAERSWRDRLAMVDARTAALRAT